MPAPMSMAASNDSAVCSGNWRHAPRWPIDQSWGGMGVWSAMHFSSVSLSSESFFWSASHPL